MASAAKIMPAPASVSDTRNSQLYMMSTVDILAAARKIRTPSDSGIGSLAGNRMLAAPIQPPDYN
jgi:hypothetical protein